MTPFQSVGIAISERSRISASLCSTFLKIRCLLFFYFFLCATSMKGSTRLSVGPLVVGSYYDFSFLAGGSAYTSVLLSSPTAENTPLPIMWVLLCTEAQVQSDILTYASVADLCSSDLSHSCTARIQLDANANNWTVSLNIPQKVVFRFVYASCSSWATQVLEANWDCMNPNGEALPAGFIPLKSLTVTAGIIWSIGALFFGFCLIFASRNYSLPLSWMTSTSTDTSLSDPQLSRAIRPLHWALLITCILFAIEGFIGGKYWNLVSHTGVDSLSLRLTDALAWDAASGALLGVVMALARGWQVTRLHLSKAETREAQGLLFVYITAWLLWQVISSIISLFALVVAYVMVVRYLFASTSLSIRLLDMFRAVSTALLPPPPPLQQGEEPLNNTYVTNYQSLDDAPPPPPPPPPPPSSQRSSSIWSGFTLPSWRSNQYTTIPNLTSTEAAEGNGGGGVGGGIENTTTSDTSSDNGFAAIGTITDGGLSDRQLQFMRVFRIAAAAYVTIDILAEIAADVISSAEDQPWLGFTLQSISAFTMVR